MSLIGAPSLAGMLTDQNSTLASYGDLTRMFVKKRPPRSEQHRVYFGRTIDANRIQSAILQADDGYMVNLTDLEGEVLGFDPHLSAVLAKRFGAISSLDWEVLPAKGPNVDRVAAKEAADMVREHLQAIPFFAERLYDLLWANYDGRAILEIHWRMQPGRYQWRPVELRWVHPRRIGFGPRFELRIIDPWNTRGNFTVEGIAPDEIPGKFVWWSPKLFREYPYREGLAYRTLYWSTFKRVSWRWRMVLTEIFALPWRILTPGENAQQPDIDDTMGKVEDMGRDGVIEVPKGMELKVEQVKPEARDMMSMNSEEVNAEMSKLVLGNTGTTDAEANRAESIIHKGEQDIIAIRDASALSARVTERLVKPDYMLNIDRHDTSACPTFKLKAEPMRDRAKEQEVADKTVQVGVPVSVKQYREITGMEQPEEGEPFIVSKSGGVDPLTGQPAPATAVIVDPGESIEDQGLDGAKDRAEADVLGMQAQRDQRDAFSVSITREQNHGHVLVIPQRDLLEPQGPQQYNIKGQANHGHALMLTSEQLLGIGGGETVTTEAAPGGERPHTHFVGIARAGLAERPKTMPFGGFEDFDDCLRTVKKGDPSLSDEAARRICGELQAREEGAARACMGHLLELAQDEQSGHDGGGGCEHDEE